ncbi:hypothetical protein, partial [Microcoleus sp. herbarium14]|uniref:hypothetical protein n=1 Tax=Microcoleus sp. herbarium14 TaxID=3055439 RepID=UPI002FD3E08F
LAPLNKGGTRGFTRPPGWGSGALYHTAKGRKTRPSQQSLTATRQKIQQAELNATTARLGISVKSCDRSRGLNHS